MASQATVPAPRVALMSGSTVYQWSNSQNFNGYILIGIVDPSDGVTPWANVSYGNLYPSLTLPVWQRIPIINGQANTSCGVFLNSDITPPGSAYVAYYYDATDRRIAGPTTTFTVTTQNAFTPPLLTLTVPSTTGTPPTPDA